MQNRLSFSFGEGRSLNYGIDHSLIFWRMIRTINAEEQWIEHKYGDISVVLSAFSVYLLCQPFFMSLWPMLRTTCILAHEIFHLFFYFTVKTINSIKFRVRSTAGHNGYHYIQVLFSSVAPIVSVFEMIVYLLHRHQDRGSSDSAFHDNLFGTANNVPVSLRIVQT